MAYLKIIQFPNWKYFDQLALIATIEILKK